MRAVIKEVAVHVLEPRQHVIYNTLAYSMLQALQGGEDGAQGD